jgi:hypothetical protein
MTPPVVEGVFSKPFVELVESKRESLSPLPLGLFIEWPFVEEGDLFGIGRQAGHGQRHGSEPNSATHALPKEG